jgi:serine/threonine protein kinase
MAEKEEPLPSRIDRYEPLRRLATGGMAEIFLAKQSGLEGFEKVVVLKRILGHLASDDEFVSMFLDEARIAAKLSHPNIVQIYDLGKTDSSYYIAMEYVSGRNVQHLINKQQAAGGHLPVEHVVRVIAGVCDGLFYAHSRKDYDGKPLSIIHRDISPQNILVSFAGGVKVVDFGIAKASTQLAQTRAGVLKGKYAYMSPEQVRGAKIDHRSDIFAVGLVMYEMLTGVRAFERDSSLKTLKAIVQEKPLNPIEMNPDIPKEVVKLLSKALEKNPDRRYKTAQEMQLALEDWLEQSPKKSNNVRLSRFMYDLFDDELQSAEGTMVVKGVGQVIIPTSQGAAKAKPAIEEEIDHKTLSAALVDEKGAAAAAPAAKPASARVRDELANKQPAKAPTPTPKPAPQAASDEDDNDGKTMPGYDLEKLERDRVAAMQKQGIATPGAAAAARGPVTAEEDEDKTRAGVPMTASAPPQPAQNPRSLPPAPRAADDSDARARAMLEKVESMATMSMSAKARTASLPDAAGATSPIDDDDMIVGPAGVVGGGPARTDDIAQPPAWSAQQMAMAATQVPPEARTPPASSPLTPAPETDDLADEPPPPNKAMVAAYGVSAGLAVMGLILFLVGGVAFPAGEDVAYGVVAVTGPAGATVNVDGVEVAVPAQVALVKNGAPHALRVTVGGAARSHEVSFKEGESVLTLDLATLPPS